MIFHIIKQSDINKRIKYKEIMNVNTLESFVSELQKDSLPKIIVDNQILIMDCFPNPLEYINTNKKEGIK